MWSVPTWYSSPLLQLPLDRFIQSDLFPGHALHVLSLTLCSLWNELDLTSANPLSFLLSAPPIGKTLKQVPNLFQPPSHNQISISFKPCPTSAWNHTMWAGGCCVPVVYLFIFFSSSSFICLSLCYLSLGEHIRVGELDEERSMRPEKGFLDTGAEIWHPGLLHGRYITSGSF